MSYLICDRCDHPYEACPCITNPVEVKRLQRRIKADHKAAVKRAKATEQRWKRAA